MLNASAAAVVYYESYAHSTGKAEQYNLYVETSITHIVCGKCILLTHFLSIHPAEHFYASYSNSLAGASQQHPLLIHLPLNISVQQYMHRNVHTCTYILYTNPHRLKHISVLRDKNDDGKWIILDV